MFNTGFLVGKLFVDLNYIHCVFLSKLLPLTKTVTQLSYYCKQRLLPLSMTLPKKLTFGEATPLDYLPC